MRRSHWRCLHQLTRQVMVQTTTPSPRRRPVLNQNRNLAVQVQVQVQVVGIPVRTRPAVILEVGKMTSTATPRARPPSKHKVRRKRKPHQPDGDSDEETIPKVTATKTEDRSDDKVKRTLQDSGVGEGATANPVDEAANAKPPGLFGADAAVLRYATGFKGAGSLPLPTALPSMATLEALTDDLDKLSEKMFKSQEETSIKVYNKVLQGFKDTSGKCKDFIHDMGALVVTFFGVAEKMEQGLAKSDAEAFREAISASKGHVCGLIEEVAEAESIYDAGEVKFDSILASVAKEVKAFVRQEGEKQRKEYKEQSLAQIKWDHGRLDGTCFIPMIIGNLSTHRALATSQ